MLKLINSLVSSLSFLGLHDKNNSGERLDESTGVSALTDREFCAVAIGHSFVPLLFPIVALTILNQFAKVLSAAASEITTSFLIVDYVWDFNRYYPESPFFQEAQKTILSMSDVQLAFFASPLITIFSLATSIIGVVLLVSALIVLGRNIRSLVGLHLLSVFFVGWTILSCILISNYSSSLFMGEFSQLWWEILLVIIGCPLVPFLCLVVLRNSLTRVVSAASPVVIILLLSLPVLLVIEETTFGFIRSSMYDSTSALGMQIRLALVGGLQWGSQVFLPYNPTSETLDSSLRWAISSPITFPWAELLRVPTLIVVQLLTLAGFSPILLKAVSLRRQGQE